MPFRYFLDVPRPTIPTKKALQWTGTNLVEWQEWGALLGFTATVADGVLHLFYAPGNATIDVSPDYWMTSAGDDSASDFVIYADDTDIPDAQWVTP